jgi:hypothetical protein
MKKSLIYALIFVSVHAFGQQARLVLPGQKTWFAQDAQVVFPAITIQGNTLDELNTNAQAWLKQIQPDLKNENTRLELTYKISSPYASYLTYTQTFRDYEIFGTSLKIGIGRNNKILSLVYKTAPVDAWPADITVPDPDLSKLKSAAGDCDNFTWKKVLFYDVNGGIPVYIVNCSKNDGSRSDVLAISTSYDIIYQNSILKNYKYPDSLVKMFVFYPDPLTSAKVPYGEPYANHNDSDVAVLDSQMMPMYCRVSVVNDSFFLENQHIMVQDLAPPHNDPTWSKTPVFHYTRDKSSFRDIMIYFHLNRWRDHLRELGYDSLGKLQIVVDPSGRMDDNSDFDYSTGPKLFFGIGGIPDAEDADVPTHEYTHYLSWSACPGCSDNGQEREALDEGTGDYFAASNSKAISTYNWQKVYNWDGNNAPLWNGRTVTTTQVYPMGLKTGDKYAEGEMWSSALMEIWDVIGRSKTDLLMLETLYSLGPNITMTQAAKLYIKSDSLVYGGADVYPIARYFIKRGFLPDSYLSVHPVNQQIGYRIVTSQFASAGTVLFDFTEPQTGTMILFDITGKEIASQTVSNAISTRFNAPGIAAGIYILNVSTNGLQKSFKLMK